MRTSAQDNFLLVECDCYENEGYSILMPNNTKLLLCEKCYKVLGKYFEDKIKGEK